MAYEVKIPSLGESVTEATLGRWLKSDGDQVAADEPILELESDKANMELAAESGGRLRILTQAGATVRYGDVVATIEVGAGAAEAALSAAGPSATAVSTAAAAAAAAAAASGAISPPPASTGATSGGSAASSPGAASTKAASAAPDRPLTPAVRRIVAEEHLDAASLEATGPRGRITKGDALRAVERRGTSPSPLATATASPAPAQAAPSPAARVLEAAVPGLAPAPQPGSPSAAPGFASTRAGDDGAEPRRIPMSRLRQVIARRMVESQQSTATLTTFNEVDMSAVLDLRARHKEAFQKKHGVSLGFMSFFVAACCDAMADGPEVNARIEGTDVLYNDHVHVGVAVGSDRGLVVPVVRHAERLGFADIEREIARLAGLARDGKLMPDDLSGATFTISNGGTYGSLLSTPILNPPQSAILGMHKIEKRPVVIDDAIAVRPMMYLALSYDHRLIDGKGAVTYLVRVKERLEDPTRLLLRL